MLLQRNTSFLRFDDFIHNLEAWLSAKLYINRFLFRENFCSEYLYMSQYAQVCWIWLYPSIFHWKARGIPIINKYIKVKIVRSFVIIQWVSIFLKNPFNLEICEMLTVPIHSTICLQIQISCLYSNFFLIMWYCESYITFLLV